MKQRLEKSGFTEEEIASALKQAELGTAFGEICRKMSIAEVTFCVWRKSSAGCINPNSSAFN